MILKYKFKIAHLTPHLAKQGIKIMNIIICIQRTVFEVLKKIYTLSGQYIIIKYN